MAKGSNTINIKVRLVTWRRLNATKEQPGDTMDDIVSRLLDYKYGRSS